MDLTRAAKPRCLDLEGYSERYEHVDQFGSRPSGRLGVLKEALLADIAIVDVEPTISAETAQALKDLLNLKLGIVKEWERENLRGRDRSRSYDR